MAEGKKQKVRVALPEGRVINHSLFRKDIYDEGGPNEGTPSYKIELAIDPDLMVGEKTFEDHVIDAACEEWGDEAEQLVTDGKIEWFKEGDAIAKDREERGKPADAYKGKIIIRAHTIYNRYGEDAPGGIGVFDEDVKPIEPVNASEIYRGCWGIAGVTLNPYVDTKYKNKCVSFYLVAFQKTKNDARLSGAGDGSDLFKPVGRAESGRRSRKG